MNTQTTTAPRTSHATKSRRVTNRTRRATVQHTRRNTKTSASEPTPVGELVDEAVQEIKNARTARQEVARQRRAELKATSNLLKKAVQAGEIPPSEDGTINGLLRQMYAQQGHTELKTFDEWKEAGYIVRKGQKAILLWGKPRKHDRDKEEATAPTTEAADGQQTSEPQEDFFPVCYVFSQLQVHAISERAEAEA